jgi:hypothetical protein
LPHARDPSYHPTNPARASAAGNLLLLIPQPGAVVVLDPAGTQWKVNDIVIACSLTSIFTMGAFALFAWVRLTAPAKADPILGREAVLSSRPQ